MSELLQKQCKQLSVLPLWSSIIKSHSIDYWHSNSQIVCTSTRESNLLTLTRLSVVCDYIQIIEEFDYAQIIEEFDFSQLVDYFDSSQIIGQRIRWPNAKTDNQISNNRSLLDNPSSISHTEVFYTVIEIFGIYLVG